MELNEVEVEVIRRFREAVKQEKKTYKLKYKEVKKKLENVEHLFNRKELELEESRWEVQRLKERLANRDSDVLPPLNVSDAAIGHQRITDLFRGGAATIKTEPGVKEWNETESEIESESEIGENLPVPIGASYTTSNALNPESEPREWLPHLGDNAPGRNETDQKQFLESWKVRYQPGAGVDNNGISRLGANLVSTEKERTKSKGLTRTCDNAGENEFLSPNKRLKFQSFNGSSPNKGKTVLRANSVNIPSESAATQYSDDDTQSSPIRISPKKVTPFMKKLGDTKTSPIKINALKNDIFNAKANNYMILPATNIGTTNNTSKRSKSIEIGPSPVKDKFKLPNPGSSVKESRLEVVSSPDQEIIRPSLIDLNSSPDKQIAGLKSTQLSSSSPEKSSLQIKSTQYSSDARSDSEISNSESDGEITMVCLFIPESSENEMITIPTPNLHTTLLNREFIRKFLQTQFHDTDLTLDITINPISQIPWIITDFKKNPQYSEVKYKEVKIGDKTFKRAINKNRQQEEKLQGFYKMVNSQNSLNYEDEISQIYDKFQSPPGFMQSDFPNTQELERRKLILEARQCRRVDRRIKSCLSVENGQQIGEFIFSHDIINMFVITSRYFYSQLNI